MHVVDGCSNINVINVARNLSIMDFCCVARCRYFGDQAFLKFEPSVRRP